MKEKFLLQCTREGARTPMFKSASIGDLSEIVDNLLNEGFVVLVTPLNR